MNIDSAQLWAPVYNALFREIMDHAQGRCDKSRWTLPGGRSSCKSSFISLVIVILIVLFPSYNAVIVRRYKKDMRYSVFEQIVWAIDKLHLRKSGKKAGFQIPKSRTAALPITYVRRKGQTQTILFVGLDDSEKNKSMKFSSGYAAILWVEEKTELDQANLQQLKISVLRGGDTFFMFESYNPPSALRHWCNAEAKINDDKRTLLKTTFLDVPSEWLGPEILHDMEQTKKNNYRSFQNIYLGIATGTGRTVFENVILRPITDEEIARWDVTEQGIDWGYYPDPYAYGSVHYDAKTQTLYIWDELYLWKHSNWDAFEKTRDHMAEHGLSIFEDRQTADSAEEKSIADFRRWGGDTRGAIKGPHSVAAGMKWLQGLRRIVIDQQRAPHAADEFTLFEYEIDKRTGEIMTGYPDGQPDHFIALTRYCTEHIWRRAGA